MENLIITVSDLGCNNRIEIGKRGRLREIGSNPAPIAEILKGVRNYADYGKLAKVVLTRWMDWYDGDPIASELAVTITGAEGGNYLYHLSAKSL